MQLSGMDDGPAAGGPGDGPAAGGTITIEINGRRFDAPKQTMNGAEIKTRRLPFRLHADTGDIL